MLLVRGRLANAADQDDGEKQDDEKRRNIEAEMPSGTVDEVAGQVLQAFGQVGGRDPCGGWMEAKPVEQIDDVGGEAHTHRHVGARVFEDQVPADDPGDQLAERRVSVGVGRAGDRNHRGQLCIAESGERTDNCDKEKRKRNRWACTRPSGHGCVANQVIGQRRVEDARGVKLLARDGCADDREDARTDDCADAKSRKRPGAESLFQRVLGILRFADQLVDGFAGKQLAWQCSSPVRGLSVVELPNPDAFDPRRS